MLASNDRLCEPRQTGYEPRRECVLCNFRYANSTARNNYHESWKDLRYLDWQSINLFDTKMTWKLPCWNWVRTRCYQARLDDIWSFKLLQTIPQYYDSNATDIFSKNQPIFKCQHFIPQRKQNTNTIQIMRCFSTQASDTSENTMIQLYSKERRNICRESRSEENQIIYQWIRAFRR